MSLSPKKQTCRRKGFYRKQDIYTFKMKTSNFLNYITNLKTSYPPQTTVRSPRTREAQSNMHWPSTPSLPETPPVRLDCWAALICSCAPGIARSAQERKRCTQMGKSTASVDKNNARHPSCSNSILPFHKRSRHKVCFLDQYETHTRQEPAVNPRSSYSRELSFRALVSQLVPALLAASYWNLFCSIVPSALKSKWKGFKLHSEM